MESDVELNVVFAAAPLELYSLLNLKRPKDAQARSETFKELETSTDFLVEPLPPDDFDPTRLIEFQGYRDKQFVPKAMVRCGLYRVKYPHRPLRCHLIYLDREFEAAPVDDGGLFQPQVHYLPDLLDQLRINQPNSPILSVLHPLVAKSEAELTSSIGADYDNIRTSPELNPEQRGAWLNVFHSWMMKRFKANIEEIQEMIITKLPDVEDLPWGQQLKERWTREGLLRGRVEGKVEGKVEGRVEGQMEVLLRQLSKLTHEASELDASLANGTLALAVHAELHARVRREIESIQAELNELTARN